MTRDDTASIDASTARARKQAMQAAIDGERRAALIVNTRSRQGRRLFRHARELIRQRGLAVDDACAVGDPARLPEIVRGAIERGHRLVIVGGGDGTISSVVGDFAHRDVVLAILPVGTANSFARSVGVPLDIAGAVEIAVDGKIADVDLGFLGDRHFANAAAIGLPASIARHMPPRVKRWFGRAGYLVVAAIRLLRHRAFSCTLALDGRSHSFDALELRIANGEYQGGVQVADDAHVESRDLVVQVIKGRSRSAIVRFWMRALLGLAHDTRDVDVLRGQELALGTTPPQDVSVDGEAVARTPIRARVARQALLVRVPRDHAEIH